MAMRILCSDLEGVFVPEVWINVAKKTGIDELKLTTRDINDYDVLMKRRIGILKQHGLTLKDIQNVIATIDPIPGALEFLTWVKKQTPLIIVSDTFIEFADPLMEKLNRPTLMCNYLEIDSDGMIINYHLRQRDQKRQVVLALKSLQYEVIAMGDSYNDISMIKEAHHGILFSPPDNVIKDFPEFPVVRDYEELKKRFIQLFKL